MIQEDVSSDQRQSIQNAGTSPFVQASPSNSSRNRPLGVFIEGANNVEITGGNFHHTHGHHINLNLAIHLSPEPPLEEYEIPGKSPFALTSSTSRSRTPYHNLEPSPTPNQFPPQSVHEQGLSTSTTINSSDDSNKIYERHLGLKRRGFPLWIPEPNRNLPMPYRRKGVSIGDVGIITPSGGFSFLFNICLSHDDPINPRTLPENFAPVYPPIEPIDIRECMELKPASYLASASIEKTCNEPEFCGLSFISSAEGALLILPDGAIAHDLENVERFREYAEANIESWYRYVNGPRGRGVKNGEVRLVIGCDKATSWGMAAVANVTQHKTHNIKYRSVGAHEGTTTSIPLYEWDYTGPWEVSVGPDPTEIEDLKRSDDSDVAKGGKYRNQCLFVRTLNITLSDAAFAKISRDLTSASPRSRNWRGSTAVISHPADTLNERILQEFPDSRVVITRDGDWCSIISKHDEIPSPSEIAGHVLATHNIIRKGGVTFLELKGSHSSLHHSRISSRHSIVDHMDSQSHMAGLSLLMSSSSTPLASSEWPSTPIPELRTLTPNRTNLMLATRVPPTSPNESKQPSPKWKRKKKMITKDDPIILNPLPTDFIVLIMGATGAGKSTFINQLLGGDVVVVGHHLESCTEKLQPVIVEGHPRLKGISGRLVIVDTPGFDDTYVDDAEILRRISVWLAASYTDSMKIGGVIYLHEISQVCIHGTTLTNTNVFRKICGEDNMQLVILATSKWPKDSMKGLVYEKREEELVQTLWRDMLDAGAQKHRFSNDSDSAWEILNTIIIRYNRQKMRKNVLQIQDELVNLQKIIPDTEAAKSLRISLQQILEMHRKAADGKETQEKINGILRQIEQLKVKFHRRVLVALGGT